MARRTSALVERLAELVDRRRHLKALVQHLTLTLQANIRRPLHVARQVTLGLDVPADAEVPGGLLEQRVRRLLLGGLGTTRLSHSKDDFVNSSAKAIVAWGASLRTSGLAT